MKKCILTIIVVLFSAGLVFAYKKSHFKFFETCSEFKGKNVFADVFGVKANIGCTPEKAFS